MLQSIVFLLELELAGLPSSTVAVLAIGTEPKITTQKTMRLTNDFLTLGGAPLTGGILDNVTVHASDVVGGTESSLAHACERAVTLVSELRWAECEPVNKPASKMSR